MKPDPKDFFEMGPHAVIQCDTADHYHGLFWTLAAE
jgi:hypothetical protein